MPRKKALEKSKEEITAEGFFPVDKESLEHATEKIEQPPTPRAEVLKRVTEKEVSEPTPEKEVRKNAVEKTYSKPTLAELETHEAFEDPTQKPKPKRKYKKRKTKSRTVTKKVNYTPPKFLLKKNGYELIITEKPQAAMKIASALGDATTRDNQKVNYYEVDRNGKKLVVACAVGHLFGLKQNPTGTVVPIFDISWKPNFLARKKDYTKRYYDTILKLAKNAGSVTVATDFDVEGEVIGLNVIRYLCNQKDASRMKFSTLTNDELNKAYDEKSPTLEWGQAIAGETRHHLDWYYGINLSRALMNAIKTTGKFRIMSIGRVQGPALKLIVEKEKEIQAFKSEDYWQIFITVDDDKNKLELKYNKDLFDKAELDQFKDLKGKTAEASTKKTEQILPPPVPFNLTTLQTEAYKFHGLSPTKTLQAAQKLYLASLISYPRTSSQKLPKELGYDKILKKLAKVHKVEKYITKSTPVEGKKTDPAHPSIYPTGNSAKLSGDEEKVYQLIVRRFLSLFCDAAIIDNKTVKATVENIKGHFSTRGSAIREKNWLAIYPSKLKENEVPDMEGEVDIVDSKIEQKETQPPKRFSPASILSQLEKRNLGTKATRANIIETLYKRNYVRGQQSIEATALGISLIKTLEEHSPIIIDEELTSQFQQKMESIETEKTKTKLEDKEKKILDEAQKAITAIAKDFEKDKEKIGKKIIQAQDKFREQQKIENKLMQCPKCKKGDLAITYSPRFKRSFIACDAYPECRNTFSLPPGGTIKKVKKVCEKCNFPLLMRVMYGKRPWMFCFNQDCKSNAELKEKREKYKKKL